MYTFLICVLASIDLSHYSVHKNKVKLSKNEYFMKFCILCQNIATEKYSKNILL